jgi:peptidoglycan hydrolase CwlO-like protein
MALDTANLSAADSADLITAARHDGVCDRLGNGDELRTANNLLDLALREKRAADAQVNALRAQLAGAESRVATLAGQLDGAQGELRSMRQRLATAQTEIDNASKRAERHEPFCACGNPSCRDRLRAAGLCICGPDIGSDAPPHGPPEAGGRYADCRIVHKVSCDQARAA